MLTKIVFDKVDCTVVEVMYSIRLLTMSERKTTNSCMNLIQSNALVSEYYHIIINLY